MEATRLLEEKLEGWLEILSQTGYFWAVRDLDGSVRSNVKGSLPAFDALPEVTDGDMEIILRQNDLLVWRNSPGTEMINMIQNQQSLTRRENTVLSELITGQTAGEIAHSLDISSRTVEKHLESIRKKLGVRSSREIIGLIAKK